MPTRELRENWQQFATKKIAQRKLAPRALSDSFELVTVLELMKLVNANRDTKEYLSPDKTADGRYITSVATLDQWIDPRIFRETQIKRFLRWLTTAPPLLNLFFRWLLIQKIDMKLSYFDQQEDKHPDKIFKRYPEEHTENTKDFMIQNLGHATQLIHILGMNILTDPVFGNLAPVFYPAMTKPFIASDIVRKLPLIDVILISHNHRDHVDVPSLRLLLEENARRQNEEPLLLFVPMGDEAFFKELGFPNIHGFEWHEQIGYLSNERAMITLCTVPANHRSGRNGHDSHHSLVMGWVISPKSRNEIVYFAGDTARLDDARINSLAVTIYQLYLHKRELAEHELPKIISLIPGGPNYTRKDMAPTHQSAVDSIISVFRLAVALHSVSTLANTKKTISSEAWLDACSAIFIHQNKFELGPDRFNENVFIFSRLLSYLNMSSDELTAHAKKQEAKSAHWSLFHRRKDFIITGVKELQKLATVIWPDNEPAEHNKQLIEFIQARFHFPLINECLNSEQLYQFKAGEKSTIIPDTDKGQKILKM